MSLSPAEVEKVSRLARLELTPAAIATLTGQLAAIVGYVEQLAELDTTDVEPMSHPLPVTNVFRADEPRPSTDRETMLRTAPHADGECYLVPAVLGE